MSLEGINVGEYGIAIELTAKDKDDASVLDISAYNTLTVIMQAPGGDSVERTGSFVTDGTDGKVEFTPQSGDFSEEGEYKYQLVLGVNNIVVKSLVEEFYVEESL